MHKYIWMVAALLVMSAAFSFTSIIDLSIPERKIGRTVEELFQTADFELELLEQSVINCTDEVHSKQLQIKQADSIIGNVFVRRVHTCDPLACEEGSTVQPSLNIEDLEYFDYFAIIDSDTVIQNITVYNYQATHGHEVAKRNWLSQFIGKKDQQFIYGENIDAISGATVSAENFTDEMSYVLYCLTKK